ncbi:MAG: hypothetical protein H6Q16_622 [Bacteroidetes bacterium]|nr:hypothetical protein [Bacteroidota bacterium]
MESNNNLLESSFNKIESSFIFLKQRKKKIIYKQEEIKSDRYKAQKKLTNLKHENCNNKTFIKPALNF